MNTNLAIPLPPVDEITIRPARESDRDSVIRIVSEIFREDASERYEWLYLGNPHGRALSWLAFDGNSRDPVAITSMFPRQVLVDGRIRRGAIGGDCYVMPAARRQGLATRLHEASFRDMRSLGVEFMYGPPWPKNLKALVKAGSTEVAIYRRYARPLTHKAVSAGMQSALPHGMRGGFSGRVVAGLSLMPHWLLECLRKNHAKRCAIEPVTSFGGEWSEFLDRAMRSYPVCCVRDPEYLNWRYIQGASEARTPYGIHHGGKLVGLVVLEKYGRQMIVVDMLTVANSADTSLTLRLAMHKAIEEGCESISFETIPTAPLARRLFRLGFLAREGRGFQVACDGQEQECSFLHDPEHWHFALGDQDPRHSYYEVGNQPGA